MKKILSCIFVLSAMLMVGCKEDGQKGNEQNDSIQVKDSSALQSEFMSPDLTMFSLKGHVKEVKVEKLYVDQNYEEDEQTWTDTTRLAFSEKGELTFYPFHQTNLLDPRFKDVLKRSKKGGEIVKYDCSIDFDQLTNEEQDMDINGTDEFVYDEEGRISKRTYESRHLSDGKDDYDYDEKGLEKYISMQYTTEGTIYTVHSTFEYLTFDEQGNWTKRHRTDVVAYDYTDGSESGDNEYFYSIETRQITYY